MNRRVHISIRGKVQGVFFRAAIEEKAEDFFLCGLVRNSGDNVEAIFEGEDEAIKDMLSFCIIGPKGAKVTGLDMEELPYTGEFKKFRRE